MIKHIIFDLGGVILNIDYQRTIDTFSQLGAKNFEGHYQQLKQTPLFDQFDIGLLTPSQFRSQIKETFQLTHLTNAQFDTAWNAILLDLPMERLEFIAQLRKEGYQTFLFSNTNSIHLDYLFRTIIEKEHFESYFDKVYYSNLFGFRKPNPEAFKKILTENSLVPNETIFLDDTIHHIEGAKTAGIQTIHIHHPNDIFLLPQFMRKYS